MIGIYCITNLVNNKKYIGQSIHIKKRWREHTNDLINHKHQNIILQKEWNYYKQDCFSFTILEHCKEYELNKCEQYWIDYFDTLNEKHGYNMVGVNTRSIMSHITRCRMSKSQIGNKNSVGERNHFSIIDEQTANTIISRLLKGERCIDIEKSTGINKRIITNIFEKRAWKHLTNNIVFPKPYESKYHGVTRDKRSKSNQWIAKVIFNKKVVFRKSYKTELEAAIWRDYYAMKYQGEKAKLNFSEPVTTDIKPLIDEVNIQSVLTQ